MRKPNRVGLVAAACLSASAVATPPGDRVAGQIDEANYQYVLDNLLFTHYGDSRGIDGAEHDPARDNIQLEFLSYGLECHLDTFTFEGELGDNVVAELTGSTRPTEIYIIGAHYDSVNNPGADDDGSGVAAVLEIARVLSQYESEATIRFIAFDLEEEGLGGSRDYASSHSDEDIRGMISLDMIAYDPNENAAAVIYGRNLAIKEALGAALQEYGSITPTIASRRDSSDHAPFEWAGFHACWLAEHDVWNNPFYHDFRDSVDSPGYINYSFATNMTRGVAGWLTDAAGVLATCPVDLSGDGIADTRDVLLFLNAWAGGEQPADWNSDGVIDSQDVLAFLGDWAGGC